MRVRGDNNPGTFSVEAMPNKPGWCLVRFYENAQEYTEELDETTITAGNTTNITWNSPPSPRRISRATLRSI